MKPPLTPDQRARICSEGRQGARAEDLAQEYHRTRAQIYQIWQAGGVVRPERPQRLRQYSFSLAPDLARKLQAYCEAEGLSFSLAVACAVEAFLENGKEGRDGDR